MPTWHDVTQYLLYTVLPVMLILVVGLVVVKLILKLVNKILEKSKLEKIAHSLIKATVRTVLYGLLILIAASRLGIDVTAVVALASVLTLAVSLSVQNALTNVISGFTLLYTKPFSSGDFVEIAGQTGTVQSIGLTYTKLHTADNKCAYIPNGSVTSAEILNYTVLGTRRVEIRVSASYDTAVQQVLEALREAARVPTALEQPGITVAVDSYGESAIEYLLLIWCKTEDFWATKFAVTENIQQIFAQHGVQMTYPHVNVHLDK
jgi:small conductance mechanosensitive channel